jgi:hypothetical protein
MACSNIGNGNLCIRYINGYTGIDMKYEKTAGSTIRARFSYRDYTRNQNYWDNGTFSISARQTRSFAWNGVYPGCVRGFLNVEGQGQFVSPYLSGSPRCP